MLDAIRQNPDLENDTAIIVRTLEAIRSHLGMDVAYLSEFVDGNAVFRAVSAPGFEQLAKAGDSHSLEDIYCNHILEGRLPELMSDTSQEPLAASMPITSAVPIGSHISLPIKLADGTNYGMFCCLSTEPNKTLNERDLQTMRMFADLATEFVTDKLDEKRSLVEKRNSLAEVIASQKFHILYQPIIRFGEFEPVAFEALCRFDSDPYRSPDLWFGDAAETGQSIELEKACAQKALAALGQLPPHCRLSVNMSPSTVVDGDMGTFFANRPMERIILEITEHAPVSDYDQLLAKVAPMRKRGMWLAVDDAGAGYASLQHIVRLRPDVIKLDMSLTRDVDRDQARRSLASALVHFAGETGATIVAEGVETQRELDTLKALGIRRGQGYLLGRPAKLAVALDYFGKFQRQSNSG